MSKSRTHSRPAREILLLLSIELDQLGVAGPGSKIAAGERQQASIAGVFKHPLDAGQ